jgi:hypothetical protein
MVLKQYDILSVVKLYLQTFLSHSHVVKLEMILVQKRKRKERDDMILL